MQILYYNPCQAFNILFLFVSIFFLKTSEIFTCRFLDKINRGTMTGNFHFTQKVNKHKSIFLPRVLKKHIIVLSVETGIFISHASRAFCHLIMEFSNGGEGLNYSKLVNYKPNIKMFPIGLNNNPVWGKVEVNFKTIF